MLNKAVKWSLPVIYLVGLILPGLAFFSARGGLSVFEGASSKTLMRLSFPFIGLYAFTFVTFQVLLATNLRWIRNYWPGALFFHRFQGMFALLFATLHPLLIILGFGLGRYFSYNFVAPNLRGYVIFGQLAWVIMVLTVTTALLAWKGMNIPFWRKLHRLNYLVFALVWTHSWFIGSDTKAGSLKLLWLTYLVLVIISVFFKYKDKIFVSSG